MKKVKGIIIIIIVLIVLGVGGFFLYNKFINKDETIKFIPSLSNKKIVDVKNGIYVNRKSLGKSINVYGGCSVSTYDDYIVVLGDVYKRYKGNCMLMKDMGEKPNNLDFEKDNDGKYSIKLDGKEYVKDNIGSIPIGNGISRNLVSIPYNYVEFVVKNTEVPGEFYDFSTYLTGYKFDTTFTFKKAAVGSGYTVSIGSYSATLSKLEDFPKILAYSGNILIIDTRNNDNMIYSNMYMYNANGLTYTFNKSLPLVINGITIDNSWSSAFRFDNSSKKFYVVFSKNKSFCVDDDSSVAYYEFSMDYEYIKERFTTPVFVKKGIGKNSCDYVKKYYFEG